MNILDSPHRFLFIGTSESADILKNQLLIEADITCIHFLDGGKDIPISLTNDKQARNYWVKNLFSIISSISMIKTKISSFNITEDVFNDAEIWEDIFQQIDDYLYQNNKWVYILYDFTKLSFITQGCFSTSVFRMLLSFWFTHNKRWQRIRCKIFLNKDLYTSNVLNFMDSSKLKNHIHEE